MTPAPPGTPPPPGSAAAAFEELRAVLEELAVVTIQEIARGLQAIARRIRRRNQANK